MSDHKVGTREGWLAARSPLLVREKEYTRLGDELAQLRRELPWVQVEKEYRFDTAGGTRTLAELFEGRSQLVVYHCYSSYARGTEFLMGYYPILDRTPKGRDEGAGAMTWLRRHDEYRA